MSDTNFLSRIGRRLCSRPQLSLLSLLVLMGVVALGVQFWLVPMLRQRAREAMLKRIADIGGQWVEISAAPPQKRLLLMGQKVDDDLLVELATNSRSLPELVQLDLFQTQVTDEGWEAITSYSKQLKRMVIFENKIGQKAIDETLKRRKDLIVELRAPDPVATGLAMTPIPPAAVISLISVGPRILAGSGDGRLHMLDANGQRPRRVKSMHDNWLFDMALSPQGDLLATAGGDNQLAIWSYPELEPITRMKAHTGDLHGVVWMDDVHLATVSDDRSLRSWELTRSTSNEGTHSIQLVMLQSLAAHEKAIPRIRISADRRRLVTASRDDRLIVWSVDEDFSIRQTAVLQGHIDDCMDVQIDPTGNLALSVGYDGALIAWDLQTGSILKRDTLADGRLFCLEVDWERRVALAGTPTGLIEFNWTSGELKALDDQPFVARILSGGNVYYTSDGFGSLIARKQNDLSPSMKATLFEKQYDHYSDDFFLPSRPSEVVVGSTVRMVRSGLNTP